MRVIVCGQRSIDYRKKLYLPGKELDMTQKEAERLIKKGIVKEAIAVSASEPDNEI